jgi:glutamyl-tRNA synthetase
MAITRLAPSPTGALHLGNARTFLVNWLLARKLGWKVLLRIEDIDGPRVKRDADRELIDDLQWLGLDWDQGPIYQSSRLPEYRKALETLLAAGMAYACVCTRREVEQAASAPHSEDGAAVYPGTCRGKYATIAQATAESGRPPAIRLGVPDATMPVTDDFAGKREYLLAKDLGDFVIAKSDGTPAYQLAVVVDDAGMGITHVVRGDDLLDSTPRQMLIYQALGWANRIPRYIHLPLVVGTDGRRLAKRHGDTRLCHYRIRGVSAGRLVSLLAGWCGMEGCADTVRPADLVDGFELSRMPRQPIVFTDAMEGRL